jgi:hypothetical protein
VKQLETKIFFKLSDLLANRPLRHEQLLCCLGKAQMSGGGIKGTHGLQGRKAHKAVSEYMN